MKQKPKKSLGQNFLINPKVAERIAAEANISKNDTVLEIGPGTGYLTKHLLARAGKVIAVEKDDELFELLKSKFKKEIEEKKLTLLNEDILKSDPLLISPLAGGENASLTRGVGGLSYKIAANIPYNITGAILKKFLSAEKKPQSMTLMVQREVAERIVARDKKESLLSISVKAYGEPKILFKVARGNFFPAPNVDSAVIMIKNISNKKLVDVAGRQVSEEKFWELVKAGFAHKRKKLSGNLKAIKYGGNPSVDVGNKRAEDLTVEDWIALTS